MPTPLLSITPRGSAFRNAYTKSYPAYRPAHRQPGMPGTGGQHLTDGTKTGQARTLSERMEWSYLSGIEPPLAERIGSELPNPESAQRPVPHGFHPSDCGYDSCRVAKSYFL